MESVVVTAIRLNAVDLLDQPKNGRWNAKQPLVPGTVEAFVPDNVEA